MDCLLQALDDEITGGTQLDWLVNKLGLHSARPPLFEPDDTPRQKTKALMRRTSVSLSWLLVLLDRPRRLRRWLWLAAWLRGAAGVEGAKLSLFRRTVLWLRFRYRVDRIDPPMW